MGKRALSCSCKGLPFADLPPELRPMMKKEGCLRQTKCPRCGKEYWTNRETDLCFDCERKANRRSAE